MWRNRCLKTGSGGVVSRVTYGTLVSTVTGREDGAGRCSATTAEGAGGVGHELPVLLGVDAAVAGGVEHREDEVQLFLGDLTAAGGVRRYIGSVAEETKGQQPAEAAAQEAAVQAVSKKQSEV